MSSIVELLKSPDIRERFKSLDVREQLTFEWRAKWNSKAHKFQLEPAGDWNIWLMLGGRGSGKTRTSAETLGYWAPRAWANEATERAGIATLVNSAPMGMICESLRP